MAPRPTTQKRLPTPEQGFKTYYLPIHVCVCMVTAIFSDHYFQILHNALIWYEQIEFGNQGN